MHWKQQGTDQCVFWTLITSVCLPLYNCITHIHSIIWQVGHGFHRQLDGLGHAEEHLLWKIHHPAGIVLDAGAEAPDSLTAEVSSARPGPPE